jgi:hypothetical protein
VVLFFMLVGCRSTTQAGLPGAKKVDWFQVAVLWELKGGGGGQTL